MTLVNRSSQAVLRTLSAQVYYLQSCRGQIFTPLLASKSHKIGLSLRRHNSQIAKTTDKVNPPASTLPPPLELPKRGDAALPIYLLKLGRAYGSFYWKGTKATWHNHQATKTLREQLRNDSRDLPRRFISPHIQDQCEVAVNNGKITRAEFQAIMRDAHDVGKLPVFGLLVMVFGEWLPLLVPFMPGVVPMTCRIPKQAEGMRRALEERRRQTFRQGVPAPNKDKLFKLEDHTSTDQALKERSEKKTAGVLENTASTVCSMLFARSLTERLEGQQLMHVSSSLGLHRKIWDTVGISPPQSMLRRAIERKVQYLGLDDTLLVRYGGVPALKDVEMVFACEERGIDVVSRKDKDLKVDLDHWLANRKRDDGTGRELLDMFFKRPNAWRE